MERQDHEIKRTDVLIVGAGPTGLTAANVLAQQGVDFRVVDKSGGPVEESRALVVHAKSLELLDRLGLAGEAVEEGQRLGAARLFMEGRPSGEISFFDDDRRERTPYPMALVHEQHRTEELLVRGLERAGGRVEWDTELLDVEPTEGGVAATIRHPDGGEEEVVEAGWLIGADGASSLVRHSLGLEFEGETYEETLFLADVEMDWELGSGRAYIDLTREGFYGFFPMPGENRFRLIGNVPDELSDEEEITARNVQRIIDERSGLEARVADVRWASIYRTHRRMTGRFRAGRIFLAGDAAHIHSPAGGQGMNTGIGDAYNLAWKLALVAKGQAHEALLDSYEAERIPFARAILNGSDQGFTFLGGKTNHITTRIKMLAVPALFRLASEVPPIRRRAFWFISQLWTQYRKSPAVEQSGSAHNGPKAGERAPYGHFETGESLFNRLSGTGHHLLVFEGGEPDAARLDATLEEIEGLLDRYELPVNIIPVPARNEDLHRRYGAKTPIFFLVRPDGHVAYRGSASDIVGLKMYLDRLFVRREVRKISSDSEGEGRRKQ